MSKMIEPYWSSGIGWERSGGGLTRRGGEVEFLRSSSQGPVWYASAAKRSVTTNSTVVVVVKGCWRC